MRLGYGSKLQGITNPATLCGHPIQICLSTFNTSSVLTSWELSAYTVCRKQEKYDETRTVFKDVSTKNIDWPEAIWEAWLTFENLHGSVEDIHTCMDRIERAQQQVNFRRAKVKLVCLPSGLHSSLMCSRRKQRGLPIKRYK